MADHAATITDTATLAQIIAINNATTSSINLTVTNVDLSGSASDLLAAFAGSITHYTGNLTVTDSASVNQMSALVTATAGSVTANVTDNLGNLVSVSGLSVGHNELITVTDTGSINAADLLTLFANTNQIIDAHLAGTITGSIANFTALEADTSIHVSTNFNAVLTDNANVSQINALHAYDSSGVITAYGITDTFTNILSLQNTLPSILENATGTITANSPNTPTNADFSSIHHSMTIDASVGGEAIIGTAGYGDRIVAGQLDILTGGSGLTTVNTYVFSAGSAPDGYALGNVPNYDTITNFKVGYDFINFTSSSSTFGQVHSSVAVTIGGVAALGSIDADGHISFTDASGIALTQNYLDDNATLSELVNAAKKIESTVAQVGFFQWDDGVNGESTYLFQNNGSKSLDNLVLIKGVAATIDPGTGLLNQPEYLTTTDNHNFHLVIG